MKIFAYEGHVGIEMDIKQKYINRPQDQGQLGSVVDTKHCTITKEAKAIIKTAKRERGSFATLMLTKHTDGGSSIAVLGFGKINLGKDILIGRDCDLLVLEDIKEEEFEAPDDYKTHILKHQQ